MGDLPQSAGGSTSALVAVNRRARSGETDIDAVLERLSRRWTPTVVSVDDPAELAPKLEQALAESAAGPVVVAGGDGTLNLLLGVLSRTHNPFGIIPLGTANDLARTLGIPADPAEAADVIVRGSTRRIDVARVNDCYFVNAASVGIGSDLHEDISGRAKKIFGRLVYPLTVLKRGWAKRSFRVSVSASGSRLDGNYRIVQLTVVNGRYYGGGAIIDDDATIDDGELDVLLARAEPISSYGAYLLGMRRRGDASSAPVVKGRVRRLRLHTRRPHTVSADGEATTRTPADFAVLPRALEVYVP